VSQPETAGPAKKDGSKALKAFIDRPVAAWAGLATCLFFSSLGLRAAETQSSGLNRLNDEVLRLHGELQRGIPERGPELQKEGAVAIRQRAAALRSIAQNDPGQALSMAFAPEVIRELAAKFPEAANQLETEGTWRGPAQYSILDFSDGSSRTLIQMNSGGENLDVHFAGPPPTEFKCGDELEVTGIRVGSTLAISTGKLQPMTASATASSGKIGRAHV